MPIFILFAIAVLVGMSQSKKGQAQNDDDVTPRPQPIPLPRPKPRDESPIVGFEDPKSFRIMARRAKASGDMKAASDFNRKAEMLNLAIRTEKRRAARLAS